MLDCTDTIAGRHPPKILEENHARPWGMQGTCGLWSGQRSLLFWKSERSCGTWNCRIWLAPLDKKTRKKIMTPRFFAYAIIAVEHAFDLADLAALDILLERCKGQKSEPK